MSDKVCDGVSRMYLMSGMSGSGKTTFAKEFADNNKLVYLGIDDFYTEYNGGESLHWNELEVWIRFFEAIHTAAVLGKSCIIDTNSPTVVDRTQFINWFPEFGERFLIEIRAPKSLCYDNNAGRSRVVPQEEMNAMWSRREAVSASGDDPRWDSIMILENANNTAFMPIKSR